ncbi:hypothetical protein PAXINDRAFT_17235 [Paxillus involutus ATCC 200175]|uniref:Uncharacterized protein n=1 Tax=Paxillus involutus ATCC 200175 TaxID=664439 RepID=A0A0C9TRD1_PAXIN|nr:hypothetical protein PAXINDRAFT_17235 [Paxillus involutus ATCC 200175]
MATRFRYTAEQQTWLKAWLPEYCSSVISEESDTMIYFWCQVDALWFFNWPQRLTTFPDIHRSIPLTPPQKEQVSNDIRKQLQMLRVWFRQNGKMPNPGWTSEEQCEFLSQQLGAYQKYSEKKVYGQFWPKLFEDWFQKWPERLTVFPDIPINQSLTAEQQQRVSTSIKNRKDKERSALGSLVLSKNGRLLSQSELYLSKVAGDRLNDLVEAEVAAGNVNKTSGALLAAKRKLAKDLLENESEEVREEVDRLYKEQVQQKKATGDPAMKRETNPERILRNIDDLPVLLDRVVELIHLRTGFVVLFICAGPHPRNDWEISATTYHSGKTPNDNDFSVVYPAFDDEVLSTFIDFVEMVYPPDKRKVPVSEVTEDTTEDEENGEPTSSEGGSGSEKCTDISTQVDESGGTGGGGKGGDQNLDGTQPNLNGLYTLDDKPEEDQSDTSDALPAGCTSDASPTEVITGAKGAGTRQRSDASRTDETQRSAKGKKGMKAACTSSQEAASGSPSAQDPTPKVRPKPRVVSRKVPAVSPNAMHSEVSPELDARSPTLRASSPIEPTLPMPPGLPCSNYDFNSFGDKALIPEYSDWTISGRTTPANNIPWDGTNNWAQGPFGGRGNVNFRGRQQPFAGNQFQPPELFPPSQPWVQAHAPYFTPQFRMPFTAPDPSYNYSSFTEALNEALHPWQQNMPPLSSYVGQGILGQPGSFTNAVAPMGQGPLPYDAPLPVPSMQGPPTLHVQTTAAFSPPLDIGSVSPASRTQAPPPLSQAQPVEILQTQTPMPTTPTQGPVRSDEVVLASSDEAPTDDLVNHMESSVEIPDTRRSSRVPKRSMCKDAMNAIRSNPGKENNAAPPRKRSGPSIEKPTPKKARK